MLLNQRAILVTKQPRWKCMSSTRFTARGFLMPYTCSGWNARNTLTSECVLFASRNDNMRIVIPVYPVLLGLLRRQSSLQTDLTTNWKKPHNLKLWNQICRRLFILITSCQQQGLTFQQILTVYSWVSHQEDDIRKGSCLRVGVCVVVWTQPVLPYLS